MEKILNLFFYGRHCKPKTIYFEHFSKCVHFFSFLLRVRLEDIKSRFLPKSGEKENFIIFKKNLYFSSF